jgi:hypothetical protein
MGAAAAVQGGFVRRPAVLKAVYDEVLRRIVEGRYPSMLLYPQPLYRAFDQQYFVCHIGPERILHRPYANRALVIRNQHTDTNRFTGQSMSADIPAVGGLYCSMQQQALVNELLHYARHPRRDPDLPWDQQPLRAQLPREGRWGHPLANAALRRYCVVRIQMMSSVLALDLSGHNGNAVDFVNDVGRSDSVQAVLRITHSFQRPFWDELADGDDYSVARAFGLAAANSHQFDALMSTTARTSSRSDEEMGDNVVFFGQDGTQPSYLWIDEAYLFPLHGAPQRFVVQA